MTCKQGHRDVLSFLGRHRLCWLPPPPPPRIPFSTAAAGQCIHNPYGKCINSRQDCLSPSNLQRHSVNFSRTSSQGIARVQFTVRLWLQSSSQWDLAPVHSTVGLQNKLLLTTIAIHGYWPRGNLTQRQMSPH